MAIQEMLKSVSDRIGGIADVDTVFGEPRVVNNKAIIPIAVVAGGFGAGGGEGKMPASESGIQQEGTGGGGGGGFMVRPLAVLEVTDHQTRLIPVLDMTRVILAGIGLLGGVLWMFARCANGKRRQR